MEPVSKPNLNRLFIGCFEKKPAVLSGKKYTSKEKSQPNLFSNRF